MGFRPADPHHGTVREGEDVVPHGVHGAVVLVVGVVRGVPADVVLQAAQSKLDKVVDRADAPVAVSYYNLAGQEVAAPKGASLKIERYSDGYTVVKKVLVK